MKFNPCFLVYFEEKCRSCKKSVVHAEIVERYFSLRYHEIAGGLHCNFIVWEGKKMSFFGINLEWLIKWIWG